MRSPIYLAVIAVSLIAAPAWAVYEPITDVRVQNAVRTDEETVRSIAGISIGQLMQTDTLDIVRERLHTSGLFADVNVYWEPYQDGVRVNIVIKEKFPWARLPTVSYSPGNISAGAIIAHGNLFGRGKRGVIGGRYSNVDSGALAAYEDPAVWGTWIFFTVKAKYQLQIIPEYSNEYHNSALPDLPLSPIRNTKLRSYGGEVNAGVAWFRKVRTSVGWIYDQNDVIWSGSNQGNPYAFDNNVIPSVPPIPLPPAAVSARRSAGTANLTFDFRARQHAVMYGNSLGFQLELGGKRWGSSSDLNYWKASTSYEHGIRFFRRHNLIVRAAGSAGNNLPFWAENSAGGTNLRGYLYRQFQGDTHLRSQVEYHFPLFSLWTLDVRGLVFNDTAGIWYRNLPSQIPNVNAYNIRPGDERQFLPPSLLHQGFQLNEDLHSSAGVGLRFYLRTVAMPLVGIDVGNALGTKDVRMILVVGV